jgi:hypothetical protein
LGADGAAVLVPAASVDPRRASFRRVSSSKGVSFAAFDPAAGWLAHRDGMVASSPTKSAATTFRVT